MTAIWANRVRDAEPQRLVTFTRIGDTREEIRLGLQTVLRSLRKAGKHFAYWGVVELHKSGVAHMHVVQRGHFIPKEVLGGAVRAAGWGHTDIRQINSEWDAVRYMGKHLCHSHGRRWAGRLIRYSRDFFPVTAKQRKLENSIEGWTFEVEFGRADVITQRLKNEGLMVHQEPLGLDWIQGEVRRGDDVLQKFSRDARKGYCDVGETKAERLHRQKAVAANSLLAARKRFREDNEEILRSQKLQRELDQIAETFEGVT